MENASNALIMAAGILIGVLILSLGVYLFVDFGSTSAEIHSQTEQQQLAQINSKFTTYLGKTNLTIYDIITVLGYAQENNNYYSYSENGETKIDADYKITVRIDNTDYTLRTDKEKIISDELESIGTTYSLPEKNISYHDNGRIKEVNFTKNN